MDGSNEHHKHIEQIEVMKSLKIIDHKVEAFVQHTIDEIEQVYSIERNALDSFHLKNNQRETLTNIH